jgi:hypothetical protein
MNTPALDYLLGAYFHQDFYQDHGGLWETVDAFVRDDPHQADPLPGEVEARLTVDPTEDELRDYVRSTGCEYRLQPEDGTYRDWLRAIARRVENAS